jgi:DUF1680 family protein
MDAPGYETALDHLWDDVVSRKMYLTGGIGTGQYDDEGFGDPYLLPNESAYCESCAAIAHVLWQHRMCLLKGQARYADLMELALYNGVLAGISISGDRFFYENPLASNGGRRSSWIGLACCPSNLARIIPQIGGLAYACGQQLAYVNLYAAGEASIKMGNGAQARLTQQTDYPWDGRVRLTVTPEKASEFTLCLRIPGWALGHPVPSNLYRFGSQKAAPIALKINGREAGVPVQDDGYVHLQRTWQAGDVVELELPMPVQPVYAHEKVLEDKGKVALMRGPIVYCLEAADHPGVDFSRLALAPKLGFRAEHRAGMLGGLTVLQGHGFAGGESQIPVIAIPYYAWANREKGAMRVWIGEASANQ